MITCGHCHESHATVAEVRECSTRPRTIAEWNAAKTEAETSPEAAYAATALARVTSRGSTEPEDGANWPDGTDTPGPGSSSRSVHERARTEVEPGVYKIGEDVIKVVRARESGRPYAKRLEEATGTFEYKPGLISIVRPEHRMTLEDAKAYGALYGVCCVCGRTLTNDESIEAGIGPICAGRL